ncbi:hypothetical protein PSAC2689_10221 [Paraburkholderia sacchari]
MIKRKRRFARPLVPTGILYAFPLYILSKIENQNMQSEYLSAQGKMRLDEMGQAFKRYLTSLNPLLV